MLFSQFEVSIYCCEGHLCKLVADSNEDQSYFFEELYLLLSLFLQYSAYQALLPHMIYQYLREILFKIATGFYPFCIHLLWLPIQDLGQLMLPIFWWNLWVYCKDKANQAVRFWSRSIFLCIVYECPIVLTSTSGSHSMCISYC